MQPGDDPVRTADGLTERAAARGRDLAIVAVLELVSLLLLVGNLATVHEPTVARIVGPIHGTLYLLGIALAFRATTSRRSRLLSVIPSVGAMIAWRSAARLPGPRPDR